MNDASGGAERVMAEISSAMADRGHKVNLLSYDPPKGNSFYPLSPNVKRIRLQIDYPQGKAGPVRFLKRISAFRAAVKKFRPDVVIPFMHSMYVPSIIALIGTGVPVIASEHTVPCYYRKRPFQYLLVLLAVIFSCKFTVVSQSVKDLYPRLFRKKIKVLHNPVRPARFQANPAGAYDGKKRIICVSRLEPDKQIDVLIRAFDSICNFYDDWDLHIYGQGPEYSPLYDLIKSRDLQERVFLEGKRADIESEYLKSHIFALPSRYESFGLATAEAMACGLPCVGFADCPGTNDLIIHEQTGLLVPASARVEKLGQALQYLINCPDKRAAYGREGAQRIVDFRPEKVVKEWEEVIEKTVGNQ